MNNENIKFPEFFPNGCPPPDASTSFDPFSVYRVTIEEMITKRSFLSYFEEGKCFDEKNFSAFAISTYTDLNDTEKTALRLKNGVPAFKGKNVRILKGMIIKNSGAIKKNLRTSHVDWWLRENFDPSEYFSYA